MGPVSAAVLLATLCTTMATSSSDLGHRCSLPVEDAAALSPERWQSLYKRRQPVVLVNALDDWPAMEKWSPSWLKDVHGDMHMKILDPLLLEKRGGFAPAIGSVRLTSLIDMLERHNGADDPAAASGGSDEIPIVTLLEERLHWIEARVAAGQRPTPAQLGGFVAQLNRDVVALARVVAEAGGTASVDAAAATAAVTEHLLRGMVDLGWNMERNTLTPGYYLTIGATMTVLEKAIQAAGAATCAGAVLPRQVSDTLTRMRMPPQQNAAHNFFDNLPHQLTTALLPDIVGNTTSLHPLFRTLFLNHILSLGGKGTGTGMHMHSENFLAQVIGRKKWYVASANTPLPPNNRLGCDFHDGVTALPAGVMECTVAAGEVLYLPPFYNVRISNPLLSDLWTSWRCSVAIELTHCMP